MATYYGYPIIASGGASGGAAGGHFQICAGGTGTPEIMVASATAAGCSPDTKICPDCKGKKIISLLVTEVTCDLCRGTGQVI